MTHWPRANQPRWLVTMTMFREALTIREIPLGADLRAVLPNAQATMRADGWQPESDGRYGFISASQPRCELTYCR